MKQKLLKEISMVKLKIYLSLSKIFYNIYWFFDQLAITESYKQKEERKRKKNE